MSGIVITRVSSLLVMLVLVPAVTAQNQMPDSELAAVRLQVVSSLTVDSAPGFSYAVPLQCGPENSVLVRFADAPQNTGLVAISADGRVVTFKPDPLGEAAQAVAISAFSSEGRVFVLYFSAEPAGTAKVLIPQDGKTYEQTVPKHRNRFYVGEFEQNGKMVDLLKLDLPFTPTRLGVFQSGAFLMTVFDATHEPKVALLKPDGQLDRYLRIEAYTGKENGNGPTEELSMARAEIASDGQKLILFHRRTRGPVVEIAAGGDTRVVKLQNIPKDFTLMSIKPTDGRWIIMVARTSDGHHRYETRTFAFSPDNAALRAEYSFDAPIGLGWACVRQGEFIGLRTDPKTDRPVITRWAAQ